MPDVLDIARAYLRAYIRDVGGDLWWQKQHPPFTGSPWTAAFLHECLHEAGDDTLKAADFPYWPESIRAYATDRGLTIDAAEARPGDVAVFGNPATFVAFIEAIDPETVTVIGGNYVTDEHPAGVVACRTWPKTRMTTVIRTRSNDEGHQHDLRD